MGRTNLKRHLAIAGVALFLTPPLLAVTTKEPRHPLDELVIVRPQLRVPQTPVELDDLRPGQQGPGGLHAFRAEHGATWSATLDKRRTAPGTAARTCFTTSATVAGSGSGSSRSSRPTSSA